MFGEPFRKDDGLEMPGRIVEPDDAHFASRPRTSLRARHDGCCNPSRRCPGFHRACKFRPGLYAQLFQNGRVIISGWPDRKNPTASSSRRNRSAGSHASICGNAICSRVPAAEQFALAHRRGVMDALGMPKNGIDRGKDVRAIFLKRVECAGRPRLSSTRLLTARGLMCARQSRRNRQTRGCRVR